MLPYISLMAKRWSNRHNVAITICVLCILQYTILRILIINANQLQAHAHPQFKGNARGVGVISYWQIAGAHYCRIIVSSTEIKHSITWIN